MRRGITMIPVIEGADTDRKMIYLFTLRGRIEDNEVFAVSVEL
jgi:hypothetical protein